MQNIKFQLLIVVFYEIVQKIEKTLKKSNNYQRKTFNNVNYYVINGDIQK